MDIMVGQCSILCKENPGGVCAFMKHSAKHKTIAVKELGEVTCIGCSMDPMSSVIRDETCTKWFAFVSYSKGSAMK